MVRQTSDELTAGRVLIGHTDVMASTLLLFPGAGASSDQATLVALDEAVSARAGWRTVRADFPYRKAGKLAPDKPAVLMQAVRDELAGIGIRRRVVVGGRSMGGRICSMVVAGADGSLPPRQVVGVVTVAYPLHPPGKPDRLRVEHMPEVTVPWLFVHGERDPFGTPAEIEQWAATVGGPVTIEFLPGGHDLRGRDADVSSIVTDWLDAF
ncbi:dienelactone hydrolase family protein [soil metagenome]